MHCYGVAAATHLNRFTEEELVKLSSQLVLYQALPEEKVASHRGDRVDHYWREIFKLLKDAAGGVRQLEWELLVKLCCTLSHGNQLSRPYKSGYARIYGHLWEIAQITPGFL